IINCCCCWSFQYANRDSQSILQVLHTFSLALQVLHTFSHIKLGLSWAFFSVSTRVRTHPLMSNHQHLVFPMCAIIVSPSSAIRPVSQRDGRHTQLSINTEYDRSTTIHVNFEHCISGWQ